ncbi:hypothetical protein SEVIR_3G019250v4 [Setaria viridis]
MAAAASGRARVACGLLVFLLVLGVAAAVDRPNQEEVLTALTASFIQSRTGHANLILDRSSICSKVSANPFACEVDLYSIHNSSILAGLDARVFDGAKIHDWLEKRNRVFKNHVALEFTAILAFSVKYQNCWEGNKTLKMQRKRIA